MIKVSATRLNDQYSDLMARAKIMRASGYHASADALLQRAWNCASKREDLALRTLVQGHGDQQAKGAANA